MFRGTYTNFAYKTFPYGLDTDPAYTLILFTKIEWLDIFYYR